MKFGLGRIHVSDSRDLNHLAQPAAVMPGVTKKWNPTWVGDQGRTPQCVGYGWAHWLGSDPLNQFLDPTGLYKLAQSFDEWPGQNYAGTSVRAGAKVLKLLGAIEEYKWATRVEQIAHHIVTLGPVVMGTEWYSDMSKPDSKGWIVPTGSLVGGHCYLVNAYYHKRDMFRILNSWGYGWARGGRAYIHADHLQKLLNADGEACIGIEKRIKWV